MPVPSSHLQDDGPDPLSSTGFLAAAASAVWKEESTARPTALAEASSLGPRQLLFRHALLSACIVPIYLLLCRPDVIFLTRLGLVAWYPATGLILALML